MDNKEQILDGNLVDPVTSTNPDSNLATNGKRLTNMIVDIIGYYACVFVIAMGLGFVGLGSLLDEPGDTLFTLIIMFLYYTLMESFFGKTFGKMITKTKVVTEDGSTPSFTNIMGRSLCRFIPFDAFTFLGGSLGWHDKFSKTQVVNDN